MGSYVFDPNAKDQYVLVHFSGMTKSFWNGTKFVEDLEQAAKFPDCKEAGKVLWDDLDDKFCKARIIPMPMKALK